MAAELVVGGETRMALCQALSDREGEGGAVVEGDLGGATDGGDEGRQAAGLGFHDGLAECVGGGGEEEEVGGAVEVGGCLAAEDAGEACVVGRGRAASCRLVGAFAGDGELCVDTGGREGVVVRGQRWVRKGRFFRC